MPHLTHEQVHIIQIIATISGVLSVLGSLSLISSFIFIKELRTYPSKLVLYLSLADLGEAIAWTLSTRSGEYIPCQIQGFFEEFFGLAPVFWQACISIYVLQVNMRRQNLEKQEIFYHLFCWGVPAIAISVGGPLHLFGHSGAWCWIQPQYAMTGIGMLYVPFVVCFTFSVCVYLSVDPRIHKTDFSFICYTYISIGRMLKKTRPVSLTKEELLASYRMKRQLNTRLYPMRCAVLKFLLNSIRYLIPFGFGWLFGMTNRIYNLANPGNPLFALFVLHAAFFPLQGFWNFWMYGLTERIIAPRSVAEVVYNTVGKEYFRVCRTSRRTPP